MDLPARLQAALADHYRLDRELGQGGMATVYLAEDLKHHRKVAVKVLRSELAATIGPERFAREIEVAARLQHPHILGLLDSGSADGFHYYVMPYVEGETLRDRLDRTGELPVPEAVRLLTEIADALAVAHRAGVVHRDIKPENVLLSGRHAMVMDFGIARAVTESSGPARLTTAGVALGTPAYMAPEQAAAEPALDHRVDIYAVGVLGYELLTGQQPFTGTSAQQILAAHVMRTPEPITARRSSVPPALGAVMMRCLEKRPADRYQTADDLVAALEPFAVSSGAVTPTGTVAIARPARRFVIAGLVLLAVLTGIGIRLVLRRPLVLTTSNAVAVTSAPGIEFQPALSPDGSQVAFVAQRDGRTVLTVRSAVAGSGGELRPAESTPGSQRYPSWSPDGEFVRFYSCAGDACLWREVGRLGGAAQVVDVPRASRWTAWSRDGKYASLVAGDSIFLYTLGDRSMRLLAATGAVQSPHSLAWSPDGDWIAYVSGNPNWPDTPNTDNSSIWMVPSAGGKPVALTTADHLNVSPVWIDDRHLLFVSNRDGSREVYSIEGRSAGPLAETQKLAGGTDAYSISLSAAGSKLALAKFQVRSNIWSYSLRGSGSVSIRDGRPVTSGAQVVEAHDVSTDGKWLVYDSNLRGNADLYKVSLDGGDPIPLVAGQGDVFGPVWSPDGREVAFYGSQPGVAVVSADGGSPVSLTKSGVFAGFPEWSPDGLSIVYSAFLNGIWRTMLLARDRIGGPWHEAGTLTQSYCEDRKWSRDGRGVLCTAADKVLSLVSPAGAVLWRRDPAAAGFIDMVSPLFSEDGLSLYLTATRGGRRGIWSWPIAGGEPHLVVAFDDPAMEPGYSGFISVHGDRLYLTVPQNESDIWVMNLRH